LEINWCQTSSEFYEQRYSVGPWKHIKALLQMCKCNSIMACRHQVPHIDTT